MPLHMKHETWKKKKSLQNPGNCICNILLIVILLDQYRITFNSVYDNFLIQHCWIIEQRPTSTLSYLQYVFEMKPKAALSAVVNDRVWKTRSRFRLLSCNFVRSQAHSVKTNRSEVIVESLFFLLMLLRRTIHRSVCSKTSRQRAWRLNFQHHFQISNHYWQLDTRQTLNKVFFIPNKGCIFQSLTPKTKSLFCVVSLMQRADPLIEVYAHASASQWHNSSLSMMI